MRRVVTPCTLMLLIGLSFATAVLANPGASVTTEKSIVSSIPLVTVMLRTGAIEAAEPCGPVLSEASARVRFDNYTGVPGTFYPGMNMFYADRWLMNGDLYPNQAVPIPTDIQKLLNGIAEHVFDVWACIHVLETLAEELRGQEAVAFRSMRELESRISSSVEAAMERAYSTRIAREVEFRIRGLIPIRLHAHGIVGVRFDSGYSTFQFRLANGEILTVSPDSRVTLHRNGYLSFDAETLNGNRITVNTETSGKVTLIGF